MYFSPSNIFRLPVLDSTETIEIVKKYLEVHNFTVFEVKKCIFKIAAIKNIQPPQANSKHVNLQNSAFKMSSKLQ